MKEAIPSKWLVGESLLHRNTLEVQKICLLLIPLSLLLRSDPHSHFFQELLLEIAGRLLQGRLVDIVDFVFGSLDVIFIDLSRGLEPEKSYD